MPEAVAGAVLFEGVVVGDGELRHAANVVINAIDMILGVICISPQT